MYFKPFKTVRNTPEIEKLQQETVKTFQFD
jgi:hypothetical protein